MNVFKMQFISLCLTTFGKREDQKTKYRNIMSYNEGKFEFLLLG